MVIGSPTPVTTVSCTPPRGMLDEGCLRAPGRASGTGVGPDPPGEDEILSKKGCTPLAHTGVLNDQSSSLSVPPPSTLPLSVVPRRGSQSRPRPVALRVDRGTRNSTVGAFLIQLILIIQVSHSPFRLFSTFSESLALTEPKVSLDKRV